MKKVKAFVVKHQVLFKLMAIVMLVCIIFLPYVLIIEDAYGTNGTQKQSAITIFQTIINARLGLDKKYFITPNRDGDCPAQPILGRISFVLLLFTIIFLAISIKKQKVFYISLILFIIAAIFSFLFFFYSYSCYSTYIIRRYGTVLPNVAFYIALLLLAADVACIILLRKKQPRRQTKSEKIAELERRIEELEKRKGGE